MKILANENFPRVAVEALRDQGDDVLWAHTDMAGARDEEILRRAQAEQRVILTHDKDFGELAFRSKLPATCGVVLLRLPLVSPQILAERVKAVLASRTDWTGSFAVIEEHRVRLRPLPSP